MTPFHYVREILAFCGLVSLLFAGSALAQRPNILLITADDMNWDSVGAYGCPVEETTPHIDRLASEGIQFDYGYVQIAICTPSRQVMLSGSHSHQTMTRCFTELERVGPALPDVLKQDGYHIANINKQQDSYDWDTAIKEAESGFGRDIPFHTEAVRRIIETAGEKPWFIMANFNDPHRPFHGSDSEQSWSRVAPERFSMPSRVYGPDEIVVPGFLPDLPDVRMEMAQYYSSVRRADDGVGAILKALEESGQSQNTIVVFLSDHGISNPFAKMNCYQTSLRVPFIVRYPGRIGTGSRDKFNMVSAVDLAPTLLELAGLDVPESMAGRSFAPLLDGRPQDGRNHVIGYYYRNLRQTRLYPEFAVQMRDWVYIYNPWVDGITEVHNSDYTGSPTLLAMWKAAETNPSIKKRTDLHKYRIREELYNVRQDPHAYINVAAEKDNHDRLMAMRALLVDWMEETDHPATELMKDPHNERLIAEYMEWERENAVRQIEEVKRGKTGAMELVSCGMSDVDAIRAEVMHSPTTPENFVDRRAALGRWWRVLWAQGYDLSAFDGPARTLTYLDADSPRAPSELHQAFAALERIQADLRRIPEVRGPARKSQSPSKTNWTMYRGIDGRNTGYSPDAGPSQGRIAWRFPKGYHLTAKPVISDGRVYVSSPGSDVVGFCLDESTGEVIWRARQHSFDFYHVRGSTWDPVLSSDRVLFRVGGMGVNEIIVNRETGLAIEISPEKGRESDRPSMGFAITRAHSAIGVACFADAETGKQEWTYTLSHEPTGQPIVVGRSAYVADQAGKVLRLNISSKSVDWEKDLQTSLIGEMDVSGELIFVGARDGRLFCLSATSGKVLWQWQCPELTARAFQPLSSLRTHHNRIYVGSASGQLYCLNATTGAVLWSHRTGSWIRSKPAIIDDTIYVATIDGDLCAVVDQGSEARSKWKVQVGAHGFVADLVANKNRILVSGRDHILYSIHPDSGEVQWKHGVIDGTWVDGEFYSCAGSKGLLTTPTLVDGVMYVSGPDGFVNAVDAEDGQEIWRFELGGHLSSTPVVAEDLVFVARQVNRTGRFCALNKKTGTLVWESNEFGPVWVAPVYRNGMLFFGNKRGDMFGVRASSGEMVWSYYTMKDTPMEDKSTDVSPSHGWPPGVYSNPAMDDEKVYVGSWSGFYFAFDQQTGALVWRTATTGIGNKGRPDSAAPLLHKNHLYVQKKGTQIAAIHKDSGDIVWEWEAPPGFLQNGSIAAHGDRIYGSVVRGVTLLPYHATIVAFNDVENGGDQVWEYDGGGGLTAPVITDDSVIFGSSADMFMTGLDANSGSLIWRTFTGGVMLENVPAIYGPRAYAHFRNGWVLAVE